MNNELIEKAARILEREIIARPETAFDLDLRQGAEAVTRVVIEACAAKCDYLAQINPGEPGDFAIAAEEIRALLD